MQNFWPINLKNTHISMCKIIHLWYNFHFSYINYVNSYDYCNYVFTFFIHSIHFPDDKERE